LTGGGKRGKIEKPLVSSPPRRGCHEYVTGEGFPDAEKAIN
jgi:hypothetical protein